MCFLSNDCALLINSPLLFLEGLYYLDNITWEVCLSQLTEPDPMYNLAIRATR